MELRQTQEIAIANANQSRTENTVELLLTIATDPVFRSLAAKADTGRRDLFTPEEQWTENQVATATLYTFENFYPQYFAGFIPADRWRGTRLTLVRLFSRAAGNSAIAQAYDEFPERWSDDFQRLIEEIRAE